MRGHMKLFTLPPGARIRPAARMYKELAVPLLILGHQNALKIKDFIENGK